jgi:hypothetical protein
VAKDETVLDSLKGLPQPRGQHYEFAHVALAEAIISNPDGFLDELAGSGGEDMLAEIWRRCREKFPSSEDYVDRAGLAATVEQLPSGPRCAVVEMPPPERMGEAYMVAAVVVPGGKLLGLFPRPPGVRYFTLELSYRTKAERTTSLFEWRYSDSGGRSHVTRGTGLAVDRAAFLAAVDEHLGG